MYNARVPSLLIIRFYSSIHLLFVLLPPRSRESLCCLLLWHALSGSGLFAAYWKWDAIKVCRRISTLYPVLGTSQTEPVLSGNLIQLPDCFTLCRQSISCHFLKWMVALCIRFWSDERFLILPVIFSAFEWNWCSRCPTLQGCHITSALPCKMEYHGCHWCTSKPISGQLWGKCVSEEHLKWGGLKQEITLSHFAKMLLPPRAQRSTTSVFIIVLMRASQSACQFGSIFPQKEWFVARSWRAT